FSSQTNLHFSDEQKNVTIKITDLSGKIIKTINFSGSLFSIDRADLKAGIYFVQITDEKMNFTNRKIVVQ
ncbi:MAG: T9SS type A sorting domain-containing protein, partial [Chitinophagaceae bacterium]|nr:T9SS type A sorting domain-containing protein [Chitinophagaceae bacterium]